MSWRRRSIKPGGVALYSEVFVHALRYSAVVLAGWYD